MAKSDCRYGRVDLGYLEKSLTWTLVGQMEEKDQLAEEVSKILIECQDDVRELWQHPLVQRLRARRKLKLEEWAE